MRFRLHNRILAIMFTMLCMGCETTDRMLTATERAVGSRTGQTVVEIIEGKTALRLPSAVLMNMPRTRSAFSKICARLNATLRRCTRRSAVRSANSGAKKRSSCRTEKVCEVYNRVNKSRASSTLTAENYC